MKGGKVKRASKSDRSTKNVGELSVFVCISLGLFDLVFPCQCILQVKTRVDVGGSVTVLILAH